MDLFNDLPLPKNDSLEEKEFESKKRLLDEENNNDSTKKKCLTGEDKLFSIKSFLAERQGERDSMEDRHVLIEDFKNHLTNTIPGDLKKCSYFAVFDGHAGARASNYCAENLHKILADKLSKYLIDKSLEQTEKEIKRIFVETFKQCDEEFLKLATKNKPVWKDGTTASVILILNNTLYSANIGDSKAIIYGTKIVNSETKDFIIQLTNDHSPLVYEERQRIQKCGGYVKDGRVLGVIEVSRSIGDGAYKAHGLSCIPDVKKCLLNSNFKFVVLACDGLWKSFKDQEVVDLIKTSSKKDEIIDSIYEFSCKNLANQAVKKLTADNVTVLLLAFSFES